MTTVLKNAIQRSNKLQKIFIRTELDFDWNGYKKQS